MNNNLSDKKHFVNTLSPKDAVKVSSLFVINRISQYVKEGKQCKVIIKVCPNFLHAEVVRKLVTNHNYYRLCEGLIVSATATLHKEDTWNERKGLDIAGHKSLAKAYNVLAYMIERKQKELKSQMDSLSCISQKFFDKRNKQFNCIEKI